MDVNHFWPSQELLHTLLAEKSQKLWKELFALRKSTWEGFAAIEETKGVIKPTVSLSTPYGQEVLRILMFRVLEEAAESLMSEAEIHIKEELIDAMNYLMSIFLLDGDQGLKTAIMHFIDITESLNTAEAWGKKFNVETLGQITYYLGGILSDKLRNRAWMQHAQDFYFSSWGVFTETLTDVASLLMASFDSFEDFLKYFIAKDLVLQFRLRSNY